MFTASINDIHKIIHKSSLHEKNNTGIQKIRKTLINV